LEAAEAATYPPTVQSELIFACEHQGTYGMTFMPTPFVTIRSTVYQPSSPGDGEQCI
jgi:hypothetical protein